MAFSRVPVHIGRALSETGRMLDKTGCRLKGIHPHETYFNRQQALQKFGEIYPSVQESTFIAPNARIIGNVEVGSNSSVGFSSTLRGDVNVIRVGDEANIGDLVTIHGAREGLRQTGYETNIGHGVTVGTGSHVHGATLEDGAYLSEGVTVLDGSVVGSKAVIASGSLVLTGTRVGPKQLWAGSPAKFVKDLTDEEVAEYQNKAKALTRLAAKHRKWDNMSEEEQKKANPTDLFARE